jgi:multiple sugar transport system substrate-binding protein
MKRHTLKAIGIAAATALVLTACAGGGGSADSQKTAGAVETGPVTITFTWWGNDDRAARYKEALALFTTKYPNITVQTSFADFPNYWTARATEAAGRALPDVMQNDMAYLREYTANSHLLDLSPYVGKGINLSGFDKALVKAGNLDGKQIAIPISTNTLALFYNPALLAKTGVQPPADGYTWQDYATFLAAVSDAHKTTAGGQKIYGGIDYATTFWFFLQWLVQEGKTPFNADGSFGFTEQDMTTFLTLTADLRKGHKDYPIARTTQLLPKGGFTMNESTSEITWDNFLAGYVADSGTENLKMMPVPTGSNGKTSMFYKPSMLYSAGANTKHPDAAAKLINFLLTEPAVGAIFGTSKGVPADKGQRDAMKLKKGSVDATVVAYEEAVKSQVTAPVPVPVKGFGSIETEYKRLGEELSYGRTTPAEFAKAWFAEAKIATQ